MRRICVKTSHLTYVTPIAHTQRNNRSAALCSRLKDRDALDMAGHRKNVGFQRRGSKVSAAQAASDSRLAPLSRSTPCFCPALAGSHSACPWQRLRWDDAPCHHDPRNGASWGESGEYRRSWRARGENRPRNAARSRKTLKDMSAPVRGGHSRIDAGQRHQVDNFMTYVPRSSASTIPGSDPPSRRGVT